MRRATFLVICLGLGACNDLRDFRGDWHGPRVGDAAPLRVGVATSATATLTIDTLDVHGMQGALSVDGLIDHAPVASIDGAEADVLSGMTFDGSPLRVYLSFVSVFDGGGEALAVIALYDSRRVEVRVLRGGQVPLYAIFALAEP